MNIFRKEYAIVKVENLERFEAGTKVTVDMLREAGLDQTAAGRRENPGQR